MSPSPLFDQTLSDVLLHGRRDAERRLAAAAGRVEAADARARAAERRASIASREARVRVALLADAAEDRVRTALALGAPPLPVLASAAETAVTEPPVAEPVVAEPVDADPVVPPVPTAAEVFRPNPGVARFLDAMLAPPAPDARRLAVPRLS